MTPRVNPGSVPHPAWIEEREDRRRDRKGQHEPSRVVGVSSQRQAIDEGQRGERHEDDELQVVWPQQSNPHTLELVSEERDRTTRVQGGCTPRWSFPRYTGLPDS